MTESSGLLARARRIWDRRGAPIALAGWAALTLALGAARAPRFWPELRSVLGQPAMCSTESDFAAFAAVLPLTARAVLVTDRTPEASTEAMFCAQRALSPRVVERRFTAHFDAAAEPATPLLVDIGDEALRTHFVEQRLVAAKQVGITLDRGPTASRVLLLMPRIAAP